MGSDGRMPRAIVLSAALLPIIVLFVATPVRTYVAHADDFSLRPIALILPFAIAIVTGLAVMLRVRASRNGTILAAIGFLLFAASVMPGSDWTPFASDTKVRISIGLALLQIIILVGLVVMVRSYPRPLLLAAAVTSAGLLAVSLVSLSFSFQSGGAMPRVPEKAVADRPNIYHFIFDGFSTRAFTGSLARRTAPALPGFTLYTNNRANYLATDASLPSIFTSSFFIGGAFRDFQARARESGIRRALQRHGYAVTTYTPDRNRFWWFAHSDAAITGQDLSRTRADPNGTWLLLQASLVRSSPVGIRWGVLWLSRLAMPWTVYNSYKQEVGLLDRFLADEVKRPERGQYVYFHIMLPHPPYRHADDCREAEEDKASYMSQAGCAALMMRRVTNHLRKLGRFDRALIIFQGDHGFHSDESDLPFERAPIPENVRRKLNSMHDSFDADALIQRSHALLLVKPAGAPLALLQSSPVPTQLIDVAPTIADTAGFRMAEAIGRPIFALNPQEPRDWHFFAGITRKHGLFRKRMGRDTENGRLAHISLDHEGCWHIHSDVVAGETSGRPAR